jgi:hypothetical protein
VGCISQASLRLHDLSPTLRYPLTAHACFDQECADVRIDQQPRPAGEAKVLPCTGQGNFVCGDLRSTQGYVSIAFDDPPAGDQPHSATVTVRDAANAVLLHATRPLRLKKFAPNGDRCGPICWSGGADFS